MKTDFYQLLYEFQKQLQTIYFDQPETYSFSHNILNLLDSCFGYQKSLMVCLANSGEKILTQNLTLHNVPMDFSCTLLDEYWKDNSFLQFDGDLLILSSLPNYRQLPLYRKLLQPVRYKDCLIRFIKGANQKQYVSCILLFSEKALFTQHDAELLSLAGDCISQAFANNIRLWNLRNYNAMLLNCTNYYPIGIMTVENLNHVTFTNQVACQYLSDLGVSDSRFYSTFFVNEIYPHYHYNMMGYGSNRPVRLGKFLFNVVATSNLMPNFDFSQPSASDHAKPPLQQISCCVYIICDETYHTQLSPSVKEAFHLTQREAETAEYLVAGKSNAEIAEAMGISANTVKVHIFNLYSKAGVTSRGTFLNKVRELNA